MTDKRRKDLSGMKPSRRERSQDCLSELCAVARIPVQRKRARGRVWLFVTFADGSPSDFSEGHDAPHPFVIMDVDSLFQCRLALLIFQSSASLERAVYKIRINTENVFALCLGGTDCSVTDWLISLCGSFRRSDPILLMNYDAGVLLRSAIRCHLIY